MCSEERDRERGENKDNFGWFLTFLFIKYWMVTWLNIFLNAFLIDIFKFFYIVFNMMILKIKIKMKIKKYFNTL